MTVGSGLPLLFGQLSISDRGHRVQCRPTGQYWNRLTPRRMAFNDIPGTQYVVNRCPCLHRTTVLPPKPE